ncbi:MAG TPA: tetrathionate reductase family octaheme c-type cytochrome [Ramlibacter sp.]
MSFRYLAACLLAAVFASGAAQPAEPAKAAKPPTLHSRFAVLKQDFQSGPEVTKACLTCHKEASKQIHQTQHWKWEYTNPAGQVLGKRHVVNNFCTSTATNQSGCATCHIGYGLGDAKFDFKAEELVDCLVCHDTTGRYVKPSGLAGKVFAKDVEMPPGSGKFAKGSNLKMVAQSVGRTSRATCGTCHFYGGGGDGVKHGDMDSSLESPEAAVDVHMDAKGLNFRCTTCHRTLNHEVPGSRYGPMNVTFSCQSCHTSAPHKDKDINRHDKFMACQTCHIPTFARGGVPTKMSWDWSTAGRRDASGKALVKRDQNGYEIYNGGKGDFVLGENVVPAYAWFNGTVRHQTPGGKIDPSKGPAPINWFEGSPKDGKSKIWPVKVFRAKQAWDPVNETLAITHLAGNDDTAFWKNLDWKKAVTTGMKAVNQPFSGQIGFIETYSMWPITHMVAPKGKALACDSCHENKNGRMKNVPGVDPD